MEQISNELPELYKTALRSHLSKQRPAKGFSRDALRIGQNALALGVDTLELARIHDMTLVTMNIGSGNKRQLIRAARFFSTAIIPLEKAHQAAQQSDVISNRLDNPLALRAQELSNANRFLKLRTSHQKCVADNLRKGLMEHATLLKESLKVQDGLRQSMRKVMEKQEKGRHRISLTLQDDIVQTLLGIELRLESVERDARENLKELKSKLANSQRLVEEAVLSIRAIARETRRNA